MPRTEQPPGSKPHLSATQLEMYTMCGEQYRRVYVEKEKLPPGIALLKGTALHAGAAVNMRQKIKSGRDLPWTQIVDAAADAFGIEVRVGGFSLTNEEAGRGSKSVLSETLDDVVDLAQAHATHQAPDYQPVLVEHAVRIELPGPRDLLGVIDLSDTRDRVTDFKTAKRKKSQNDVESSVQLSVYSAAFQAEYGRPPSEVRLDTLVQTKSALNRQVVSSNRGQRDFNALAHRINVVNEAIDKGVFTPAPAGAWQCSSKWCGFFNNGCPYVNPERAAAAGE